MATLKQANKAREQHSDKLTSIGVHSIGVNEVGKKGSKKFCVVAYVQKHNKKIPVKLTITAGKKKVDVPVVAQVTPKFKAE